MKIETQRLIIFPLSYDQLISYLKSDYTLENELRLESIPRTIPHELADAFIQTILPAVACSGEDYLFSTLWTIVLKEKNVMVGDLCFKGKPNGVGEIEIGYGTYDGFQGNGYMSEAIEAIVKWGFSQPTVCSVIAETDETNKASHRVLAKNGFTRYKTVDQSIWWKLEKSL